MQNQGIASRKPPLQRGFTLIELIVVLVILGILAAFAIPRFVGVNKDARQAAVRGLAGSFRSASALVHGLALARSQTGATGSVTLEGQAVDLAYGYPTSAQTGIGAAVLNLDGYTVNWTTPTATGPRVFTTNNLPLATTTCSVTYTPATAPTDGSTDGVAATVTMIDTGC